MSAEPEPVALNAALEDLQRALRGQRARRSDRPIDPGRAPGLVVDATPDRAPVRREL